MIFLIKIYFTIDPIVLGSSESSFRFLRNFVHMIDHVEKFFAEKPERFCKHGIFKFRERWRKVAQQNDTYIIR